MRASFCKLPRWPSSPGGGTCTLEGGYPVGGAGVKRRVPLSPDPRSSRHHRLQHLQLWLLPLALARRCLLFSRPPSRTAEGGRGPAAEQRGTRGEERGGRARPALARVSPAWRRHSRGAAPELAFRPSAESPRGDVTPTPPPSLPEQSNSELTRAATAEHGEPSPGSAGLAGHARAPEVVWTPPRRQKKCRRAAADSPVARPGFHSGRKHLGAWVLLLFAKLLETSQSRNGYGHGGTGCFWGALASLPLAAPGVGSRPVLRR